MDLPHRAAPLLLLAFVVSLGLASAAPGAARAQNPEAEELKALKNYGVENAKSCEGWTDGCAICVRRGDGTLGCSRLGVDCQASDEIQCTQRARDPKTGKTPPPE